MGKATRSQNPYTQSIHNSQNSVMAESHRNSANRERGLDSQSYSNSQSHSKSQSKSKVSTDTESRSTHHKHNHHHKSSNNMKKELQKLFMVLKSKDEEIERLKLRVLQLKSEEKVNHDLSEDNAKLERDV